MYLYITYCPWDHIPRSFMCTFLGVFCLTSHFFHVHGFRVQQRPPKENHWELLKQFVLHADASCGPVNTVKALKVFLHKHKRTHFLAMLHKTLLTSVFVSVCVKNLLLGRRIHQHVNQRASAVLKGSALEAFVGHGLTLRLSCERYLSLKWYLILCWKIEFSLKFS